MLTYRLITTTVKNDMVDLHTHILPNIDDGASSYEEALDMLRTMIEDGVTTVVATPHFNFEMNSSTKFINMRDESIINLKLVVNQQELKIKILRGAELMFTPNMDNYDLSDFTIEGTDYLLIELSTKRNEPDLEYTLSAIIANGYIPILAHIERYSYLIDNSQRLINLIEMGVLMQVNAKSLYDKKRYPFIEKLISNKFVHLIASDAHDMSSRVPNLVKKNVKSEYISNQNSVINNLIVNVKKPKKYLKILNLYI